ncbi:hypothetical protein [Mucilaginibacter rubeus]|uniref:AAA+ ATPase domain-containing protein n=1 Tax=Mucilaginibacter rubeus TaxID=2027860 RepID=A0A5C1I677_9SPHI|nr:hypothetical protein [Mucilaginibacter rubeus]QEM13455.1 hypothetical protein DEO27_026745 [Mucilaginibacter rubeus]
MNTIGVFQINQKKYDTIELLGKYRHTISRIPKNAHITFYGDSGQGKTEAVMQFVKELCLVGLSVDWVSYEQGHGYDLQLCVNRNNMIEVAEYFQLTDPDGNKDENTSYFDDLVTKVGKRGSADIFVIDSVQFTDFKVEDFKYLLKKFKKKGFIWISHKEPSGKLPKGSVAQDIARLGHITILVKNYIAEPLKNRFGGNEKYVIYEQRARLLEPKFFAALDKKNKTENTVKEIFESEEVTSED